MQKTAQLHSIETCGAVDGPGLRYVAFFQGCIMRCLYCHNRDTWDLQSDKAQILTVDGLMKEVRSYQHYLKATGGGVTASGGEPLLQYDFIADWFEACQAIGLNTCLDTSGFARRYDEDLDRLIVNTDLVMLDLKQIDAVKHKELVGVRVNNVLKFARYLAEKKQPTRIRRVVVPNYTDDDKSTHQLGEFIADMDNIIEVELLPYHELGVHKWKSCGTQNRLEAEGIHAPPRETLERMQSILEAYGKPVFF